MKADSLTITMISDDFIPAGTGVGIHVQRVSQEMARRGHKVIVLTTRRQGQPPTEMWEGVKVYRVFSIPMYGFYQALPSQKTLRQIFFENRIQIVHCHYLGVLMLRAMKVAKRMGIPTVLTTHMTADHLTQPGPLKPWRSFLSYLIARVYEKFSDVICVSSVYAKQVERFDVSSTIHYISNPIDFDGAQFPGQRPMGDPFRVLFAGRLNPEKNVGLLIKAFASFYKKYPGCELAVAGKGDQENNLRQLAESLGIKDAVKFLGHVPHDKLPELYSSADVFVLPSLVETQGMVALEAMRFKLPVIVTDRIITAKELVDEGQNGYIVDAYDPAPLSDRLCLLRDSPGLRKSLGEAGYQKSSVYSISSIGESLENVYHKVRLKSGVLSGDEGGIGKKRLICPFCEVGTFEQRAEHMVFPSNAKQFKDEFFAVWRCAFCRSVHSYAKFPLKEYYQHFPYSKRKVNVFNRLTFENLFHWVSRQGLNPEKRILFYGFTSGLFKDYFTKKGYRNFEVIEEEFSENLLAQQSGVYDAVIIFDFLERIEEPQKLFDFVRRILKPGEKFFLLTTDADKIKLPAGSIQAVQQPYRLHIPSWIALESLIDLSGFRQLSFQRRHYLDTLVPFINSRALHDMAYFHDGSLDSAFTFSPRDIFKKFWRIPRFIYLGLFGGIFRDRSNLMLVFKKS